MSRRSVPVRAPVPASLSGRVARRRLLAGRWLRQGWLLRLPADRGGEQESRWQVCWPCLWGLACSRVSGKWGCLCLLCLLRRAGFLCPQWLLGAFGTWVRGRDVRARSVSRGGSRGWGASRSRGWGSWVVRGRSVSSGGCRRRVAFGGCGVPARGVGACSGSRGGDGFGRWRACGGCRRAGGWGCWGWRLPAGCGWDRASGGPGRRQGGELVEDFGWVGVGGPGGLVGVGE